MPYAFEDDKGKLVRGVTIYQNGNKVFNYFWDNDKKEPKHGYPAVEGENLSKDDWKIHFLQARKFLVGYVKENIVPKFEAVSFSMKRPEAEKIEYPPEEDINPEDIPF